MNELLNLYLKFWIFTIPLTIYILKTLIPELLDLILNTQKIDSLLYHSDNLCKENFENQHIENKKIQANLNPSNLKELERQMNYFRLTERERNYTNNYGKIEKIKIEKKLSDIFKL